METNTRIFCLFSRIGTTVNFVHFLSAMFYSSSSLDDLLFWFHYSGECVLELTLVYVRQSVYSPSMLEYFHNVLATVPQHRVSVVTQSYKKRNTLKSVKPQKSYHPQCEQCISDAMSGVGSLTERRFKLFSCM